MPEVDPSLGPYAGREQAYIKHFLLGHYLSDLIHKIASSYSSIVYIDGYAGPWQSAGEGLEDTSFVIALAAMHSAKAAWKANGREVRMRAVLVEKDAGAFRKLESFPPRYPDVEVCPIHGDFVTLVPTILRLVPANAFAFVFIDPKGWLIDSKALAPLLRLPNCEVLLNFMFDFINRAASMSDPRIISGLDALLTSAGWRERLNSARPGGTLRLPDIRKSILVDAISQTLTNIGGFEFVAETPIFRPTADRTLYSLIYATRKPPGIEVFRRVQKKTLLEQESVRAATRQRKDSGAQSEAFLPSEMRSSETEGYFASERRAAEKMLFELTSGAIGPVRYGEVWPKVLAKHAVTKPELNKIAGDAKRAGRLIFPEWEVGKRVPSDAWHVVVGE